MQKIKKFVGEIAAECKQMVWPAQDAVLTGTSNAVLLMISSAALIYALDQLAQMGLRAILMFF